MSTPTTVCGSPSEVVDLRIMGNRTAEAGQDVYSVVPELPLWPNGSTITIAFMSGSQAQKELVKDAFAKYKPFVNLSFVFAKDGAGLSHTDIRITFDEPKAWSAIGTHAQMLVDRPTMELGVVDKANPSSADRAIVIHQVGHALGLGHEWDGKSMKLTESGADELLKQHVKRYGERTMSNFPQVDKDSIMSYFAPANATPDGKGLPLNWKLSDKDKAWLGLNYPGSEVMDPESGEKWTLDLTLSTLGGNVLIDAKQPVTERRAVYAKLISETWSNQTSISAKTLDEIQQALKPDGDKPSPGPSPSPSPKPIDPISISKDEEDRFDILAAVLLHPQFHAAITNLVEHDLAKNIKIELNQYPIQKSSMEEVPVDVLAPLLLQLANGGGSQSGIPTGVAHYPGQPQALSPEIQQGIFSFVAKIVTNPTVRNIITTVAKEAIKVVL